MAACSSALKGWAPRALLTMKTYLQIGNMMKRREGHVVPL
ncbi:hypothetical protein LINGRAHAP2_LOCUS29913 [Linum grandiflorum]